MPLTPAPPPGNKPDVIAQLQSPASVNSNVVNTALPPNTDNLVFEGQLQQLQTPDKAASIGAAQPQAIAVAAVPVGPPSLAPAPAASTAKATERPLQPPQTQDGSSAALINSGSIIRSSSNGGTSSDSSNQDARDANGRSRLAALPTNASGSMDFVETPIPAQAPVATSAAKSIIGSSKTELLPINDQMASSQTSLKTDLAVRLQAESGENINIRLSERGGELQVSIRSTDQQTASTLRGALPAIQAGLERSGWNLEASQNNPSGGGRDSSGNSQGDGRRQDDRQQQPEWQDQRQQQRRPSSAEQWLELAE
jgi:hypothetical protein